METDIFYNIFLLFILAMACIGMVQTINYLERIITQFIRDQLEWRRLRRMNKHNLKLINKRMSKIKRL